MWVRSEVFSPGSSNLLPGCCVFSYQCSGSQVGKDDRGHRAVNFVCHRLAFSRFPPLTLLGALPCTHSCYPLWRVTSVSLGEEGQLPMSSAEGKEPASSYAFCCVLFPPSCITSAASKLLFCFFLSLTRYHQELCLFGALRGKLLLLLSPLMSSAWALLVLLGRLPPIHLRSNLHN